ncbi:MAG: phenylalanine--tRNA ligase subunit beta [Clostridia bacterium]
MKMPMSWLNDYITPDVTHREYMEDLTMSGSKVEGIEFIGEEITNVLTGKITQIDKHPDAEKLVVCQLDVAGEELIQIVTGAPNVSVGDIVPVAMHKSTLADGVKITRGNLRGVKSNGMLCSYQELGLSLGHVPYACENGILLLPEGTPIGADIRDILGLNDHVVEFEITSNRPDCMSILGLARETFATYGQKFAMPEIKVSGNGGDVNEYLSVEIQSELCQRYTAKVVTDVKIEPSPAWLRHRLSACGIRPINNIVDITNYVLLEYGQPMHAFDYTTLEGKKVIARQAVNGEKFTTLDDVERTLDSSMLVIADGVKTSAVAGVMGGLDSEIKDNTRTIVFESATFEGASVRVTAKKLGLRTEASAKFEKGLDPENTVPAIMRACELIEMLGAGKVVDGIIDVYPNPKEVRKITLDQARINKFLGTEISREDMIRILDTLDFGIDGDQIIVPSYRDDVVEMADVAEEIARIYGYNKIEATSFAGSTVSGGLNERQTFEKHIGITMRSLGYDEIITYSFISPKAYDKVNLPAEKRASTTILNPLGEDTSIMRTTTIPSMMDVIVRNMNFRNPSADLYEIGTVYFPVMADDGTVDATKLPEERKVLTISSYGKNDFYVFKGMIESLLADLKVSNVTFKTETENTAYHTGRCAKILVNDKVIGVFGNIHPEVLHNYGTNTSVLMCELDVTEIFTASNNNTLYKKLPKFPASTRDISFVCDKDVEAGSILVCIKRSGGKFIESATLFDVFISEKLGHNKKSMAYSITMRKTDGTLTDEECDSSIANILKNLEKDFGAVLRS